MKNQLFIALCSVCVVLAAQAGYAESSQVSAGDDLYVNFNTSTPSEWQESSGSIFYTPEYFIEDNEKYSIAFGYRISGDGKEIGHTRIEAEFLWQEHVVTDENEIGSNIAAGMMANVLYDFHTDSHVTPYFGIGAGAVSINDSIGATISRTSTAPAYQTMAGVSYTSELYPYTSVKLGYRYFSTIAPVDEYSSHNLDAGVRVAF